MNKFDIGDLVKVVEYGHIMWESDGKGSLKYRDMSPNLVGQVGIVDKVKFCQGRYSYALNNIKGKHAWYDEGQLEMVNRNPNNDIIKTHSNAIHE